MARDKKTSESSLTSEQEYQLKLAQLQQEQRLQEARIQSNTTIITTSVRSLAGVMITGFGYLMIASLAGHHTFAQIGLNVLGNMSVSQGILAALAGGGVLYGGAQARLRKESTKHLQGRVHQREVAIDPERSSSRLTATGDTPPEEQP